MEGKDDLSDFGVRLSDETLARYRRKAERQKREFIRGPIPVDWVVRANRLPGQSLVVGLAIWFLRGVKKKDAVRFGPGVIRRFGLARTTTYRALAALESAGLITVTRHRGRAPIVTIREAP